MMDPLSVVAYATIIGVVIVFLYVVPWVLIEWGRL